MSVVKYVVIYQETQGGVWQLSSILCERKSDARLDMQTMKAKRKWYAADVQQVTANQLKKR